MSWPASPPTPPSASTIALLWDALHAAAATESPALTGWCMQPVHTAHGRMLWPVGCSPVLAPGQWTDGVGAALLAAGCRLWAAEVAPPRGALLPASAVGVLRALSHAAAAKDASFDDVWGAVTASHRDQLRAFLLQVRGRGSLRPCGGTTGDLKRRQSGLRTKPWTPRPLES